MFRAPCWQTIGKNVRRSKFLNPLVHAPSYHLRRHRCIRQNPPASMKIKMSRLVGPVLAAMLVLGAAVSRAAEPLPEQRTIAPGPFLPNWASLAAHYKCPDWFRDAKLGIWAHWSAQSVPEEGDWYARNLYMQ